jgi:4'-phosphopantetheinyl transferase
MKPPAQLALEENEAHVWLAHLPTALATLEPFASVLSSDEQARAEKFHFTEHRERWQTTRAILRLLLARYLETKASEITFDYNPHGKPSLKNPVQPDFHFNTSHSGDYAVFAFTRIGPVGVDIECIRNDMTRHEEIACRYFARGEYERLQSLPESERARAFFEYWTRKEAFVKARGDGLFSGLDQFEVSLTEPRVLSIAGNPAAAARWRMAALPKVSSYTGALALQAPSCVTQFWEWSG